MAGILDKVNTLIRANLNSLIDQALQRNSVAVLDEYIRQAESNLDQLNDAAATVGGNVKTLKRKGDQFSQDADDLDRNIDELLRRGRQDLAMAAQAQLNDKRKWAAEYQKQYEEQQAEYQQLMSARMKLEAKLTNIKQEREHLKALLELAKSKEVSLRAIKSVDDLAGVGDADIARLGESIRSRLDRASAQSELAASHLDDQMSDILEGAAIDAQLAERKKRLGLE